MQGCDRSSTIWGMTRCQACRLLRRHPESDAGRGERRARKGIVDGFLGPAAAAATGAVALSGLAEARQGSDAALSGSDAGDLAYLDGAFERHHGGYRGRPPTVVLAQMRGDLDLLWDVLSRPNVAQQVGNALWGEPANGATAGGEDPPRGPEDRK